MTRRSRPTRRRPRIQPREVVLIVCEGEKTEPNYFRRLRQVLRLTSADVVVIPEGAAPITVVEKSLDLQAERQRDVRNGLEPCDYDQIWCVFDVEQPGQNPSLAPALAKARANKVNVALSNPCFEYWLLLHFERVGRAFTSCRVAIRALRRHVPRYQKGDEVSEELLEQRSAAAENAAHIDRTQWWSETDRVVCNPSTEVYKLVGVLEEMASRRPYP
ncbi:MAG TPA: RloB family protein [Phycisphaerae bacterium]|nr:RloB family protein [Phycisphaerae bacterium]